METKFTPGPWKVVDRRSAPRRNILIVGTDDSHIAEAEGVPTLDRRFKWNPVDTSTAETRAMANAQLIAAAPDLYEACKLALTNPGSRDVIEKAVALADGQEVKQ